jgi:hypothetical protein
MNKHKNLTTQAHRPAEQKPALARTPTFEDQRCAGSVQRFVRRFFYGQISLHWFLVWVFVCGMLTSIFSSQFPTLWTYIKSNIFLTCVVYVLPGLVLFWNRR